MKSILFRYAVVVLVLAMAVQVFRVSRDTADAFLDRFGGRFVTVGMRSDRSGTAVVYWNTGKGFNEADSASVLVRGGERWERLRIPVPSDPLRAVRFDPLRSEGQVEIRDIRLETGSGRPLLKLQPDVIRSGTQVESMTIGEDRVRVVFPVGADDPTLHFGAMIPEEGGDQVSLPWLGFLSIGILLFVLFLMREYTVSVVRAVSRMRTSVTAWIEHLGVWDKPGRATLMIGGLLTVVLQVALLYPLHEVLDLPIWDEAGTMGGGAGFLRGEGLGILSNAPLSKLIYAGLIPLFGPAGAVFATHYLVKVALTLIVFLLAARFSRSILAGLVLSGVWTVSSFHLEFPILVYQSALIWFGWGLLAVGRNPLLGLALFALAALTRLEYQFVAILVAVALLFGLLFRWWNPRVSGLKNWTYAGMACCLVVYVSVNLTGWDAGIGRGWSAVKQHYALRLAEEGAFPGNNPFLEFGLVTERDFPGAESLSEAARENPRALFEHISWNIRRLPGACLDLFVPFNAGRLRYRLPLLAVFFITAVGLIEIGRSPRRATLDLRALVVGDPVTCIAILGGVLVIAPGVIVFAKSAYLLPVVPLGLAVVGFLHRMGSSHRVANRIGVLLALILVMGAVLGGPRPFMDRSRARPVVATLKAIEEALSGDDGAVLLGVAATTYAPYLELPDLIAVEPLVSSAGGDVVIEEVRFDRLIKRHDPDLILIDSNWSRSAYFDAAGAARLSKLGWTETAIPDGSLWKRP
ncbi:MAG: hypothetical protein DRP71_03530 [Verrucomicrobia bacterium]|nr:MAG: hypothetical protein DRP71_03530 [Verrucomicrobiota bacterium]